MPETPRRLRRQLLLATILSGAIVAGCDSDQRVVELSRESMNRQAEQNSTMARQNQAVTETTKELIKAESDVQRDANQLQERLQAERAAIDQQRQDLENERRSQAAQRQRDPIIAEAIKGVALIVVAALPLVVCWYLVWSLFLSASDDATAAEVLIEQLATQGPLLEACSTPRLPYEPDSACQPAELPSADRPRLTESPQPPLFSERNPLRVLVVLEGVHDVEFLKRMARALCKADSSLPDLERCESDGTLVFAVQNGSAAALPSGLGNNGLAEFHLLDSETGPLTAQREITVRALNVRPNCRAVLTSKRTIENYLHPDAIREAGGVQVSFNDCDDVAEIVAQACLPQDGSHKWETLSRRARRRLRDQAKHWLNREAVDRMTPERLSERDPGGEVIGWLKTIAQLASGGAGAPA